MKKLLVIMSVILCIYLIYFGIYNNRINYVSISDNTIKNNDLNYDDYLKEYLINNNRLGLFNTLFTNTSILSVYQDLLNNRTIRFNNNDYYFKKVLRESDLVVINIGMEEIASNYNKDDMASNINYFEKMYFRIEKLVLEIKKYSHGKIVFIGYYNPTNYYDARVDELFYNIDSKLEKLMNNNNVIYVDLYNLVKSNKYQDSLFILNNQVHNKIANCLISFIE